MPNFPRPLDKYTEKELYDEINGKSSLEFSNVYLNELIKRELKFFSQSSDKYSRSLIALTWLLVVLTVILAWPIIKEIFNIK